MPMKPMPAMPTRIIVVNSYADAFERYNAIVGARKTDRGRQETGYPLARAGDSCRGHNSW